MRRVKILIAAVTLFTATTAAMEVALRNGRERPALNNLRDSGSLEQDADVVILLHREDYYERTTPGYQPNGEIEIIIAKNKDGAAATVTMRSGALTPAGQRKSSALATVRMPPAH